MFKKILLTAAVLLTLVLGASAAPNAGYGYGYDHGYGYGYGHHAHYTSYSYQPSCYMQSRPMIISVWDDHSCEYTYRTVYRSTRFATSRPWEA
jgi:hypothetical protein